MSNYTTKYPHKTVYSVKKNIDFNNGQNQEGQGLKILTPQQMLSRLPISLAQLKAGNNSEKRKNEIGEIASILETVEVVLVHCNLVNNNYQQASKVLFTCVPNKQFRQLITVTPHFTNNAENN